MAGLVGSYVNQVLDLNLTGLGSEDFISFTSGGVAIRKTGGGSLLTAERWDWGSNSSFGAGGNTGFGGTGYKVTTTDATASNITNKADCVYTQMDNTQACGWKVTAPAGLGERVIKLYFAHYLPSGQTETLHLTASISGTGAPTPIDVSLSTNNGSDTDLTATITYTAGQAGQTITIGYYPSASATGGYRYMGLRGVWVGPAASSASLLSSAGTGAASFVGASLAVGQASMAGVAGQNLIGGSLFTGILTVQGSGVASFAGIGTESIFSIPGVSSGSFVGSALTAGLFSAAGAGGFSATGQALVESSFTVAGLSEALFVGGGAVPIFTLSGSSTGQFSGASINSSLFEVLCPSEVSWENATELTVWVVPTPVGSSWGDVACVVEAWTAESPLTNVWVEEVRENDA